MNDTKLTPSEIKFIEDLKKCQPGICQHDNYLIHCDICYLIYQAIQTKNFFNHQEIVKETYKTMNENLNNYYAITGGLYQPDYL